VTGPIGSGKIPDDFPVSPALTGSIEMYDNEESSVTDTTTNEEAAGSDRATQLRNQVVDDLIAKGTIVSAPVEAAMRKVPRESFAPGVNLEEVYHAYTSVVTKRDENGRALSSVSALHLHAHMLEQAEITVGMRVLEVGSGGYNAALLAELVGPSGQVITVDIDEDITDRASHLLADAGYSRVTVVLADAEGGVPSTPPTTGSWSPRVRGTSRRRGWLSWPRVGAWWCRCRCGACHGRPRSSSRMGAWSAGRRSCSGSCRCRAPGRTRTRRW